MHAQKLYQKWGFEYIEHPLGNTGHCSVLYGWLNRCEMTHKEFRLFFDKKMTAVYPKTEVDSLYLQLMEFALNMSRAEMILKSDETIEK